MNLINYNYFKDKLLKNDENIKEINNKISIINKNRHDIRWIKSLLIGLPIYFIQSIIILNFINITPVITTTFLLINSIILGKITESIIFFFNKSNNKINNKSYKQLIIDEVNYNIKKEELIAENELLEKMTIYIIKNNEKCLHSFNPNKKDKENISILCKKKVLKNTFIGNFNLLDSFTTSIATGGVAFSIIYIITSIIYGFIDSYNIIFDIFIPSILVSNMITISVIKDNITMTNIFKKINNTLGNNKLIYKDFSKKNIELELENTLINCNQYLMKQYKNTYLNESINKNNNPNYKYHYNNELKHSNFSINTSKKNKIKKRILKP